jgi:hypothetical protein
MNASDKTNSSNSNLSQELTLVTIIIAYIPLFIIALGFLGNFASFIIFRLEKYLKSMPSMVYLSFCCLTDSFSLITWNLDHFLKVLISFKFEFQFTDFIYSIRLKANLQHQSPVHKYSHLQVFPVHSIF